MSAEYYKVLNENQTACHGGSGRWTSGVWRTVRGPLVPCEHGLHVVTCDQLVGWLGPAIWRCEIDESQDVDRTNPDKIVVRRARITERLDTWTKATQRLFAADCAEHVLPLFEAKFPDDDRPRKAIAAARAYARGEITGAARAAAWAAVWDARAAVWDARAAVWDAAHAARAAAHAPQAAKAAARDAAREAAHAAEAAAWAFEGGAWPAAADVREAAWAAASAAAGEAERQWQTERLWHYLDGGL